jgi:hypothetical protein
MVVSMSADTQITQPPAVPVTTRVTAPSVPAGSTPPTSPTSGAASAAPASPPAFSFQLQIDPETQRVILEARDPVTGFVIFEAPPKTAFSAINGGGASNSRGGSVDRDV